MDSKLATFAFYNVENFYAKIRENETSFLPSNFSKWVEGRYDEKVAKIAFTIAKIGYKETQDFPLLVGFSEVEDKSVLEDLINDKSLANAGYESILYPSLDERNINVGCIFRKDIIDVLLAEPLRVVFKNQNDEKSFTRDILFLKTRLKDQIIYFFILHLPSKLDFELNQLKRSILLNKIKHKVEEIKSEDLDAKIIIMGDFNDSPTADNIREILQTNAFKDSIKKTEFYNPMVGLMSYKRGSLVHKKQWMLFDQMLFSSGFFTKNSNISYQKTEIFDEPFLTVSGSKYGSFPFRTFIGTKYLGGYSDHFPVYTIIKY